MRVQRLAIVDDRTAARLWELYRRAFSPVAARSVLRQSMSEHHFLAQMRDPRVWKYVGYDGDEEPVAVGTLTRHLETDPWLSPEYFASHLPQEYAEGRIYYVGFLMVDPSRQSRGLYLDLIRPMARQVSAVGAVAAFDVSRENIALLDLFRDIARGLNGQAVPEIVSLDAQQYYAMRLGVPGETVPTLDGETLVDLTEAGAGRPNR